MQHRGFTHQELRDVFDLDPDRPQDRSSIAALQASATRRLADPPAPAARHGVRGVVRLLLGKRRWQTV